MNDEFITYAQTIADSRLRMFVALVLHGSDEHKKWLIKACENFIEGRDIFYENEYKK